MNKFFSFGITALGLAMITTLGYPAEVEASGGSYQRKSTNSGSRSRGVPSFDNTKRGSSNSFTSPTIEKNQNLYNKGKAILRGEAPLAEYSESLAQDQLHSLNAVAEQLPASAKKRLDVEKIAGRLSADQLKAVKHYLKVRYLQ